MPPPEGLETVLAQAHAIQSGAVNQGEVDSLEELSTTPGGMRHDRAAGRFSMEDALSPAP